METQPIVLALEFISPLLLGEGTLLPLALGVTLSLLATQWWSMWLQQTKENSLLNANGRPTFRSLSGILLAMFILCITRPDALSSGGFFFAAAGIAIWSWYRGILRAREPLNDGYLTTSFRAGFLVLLVVMAFAILRGFAGSDQTLSNEMARALPVFFLSGLIALSFTRIGKLKREQQRHPGSSGREATGRWLSGLTITWVALVVASVALEALPLNAIMMLLNPFWSALLLMVGGILYLVSYLLYGIFFVIGGIIWLLNLLFHFSFPSDPAKTQQSATDVANLAQHTDQVPALLIIVLGIVFLFIVLLILSFAFTRKKKPVENTTAEEEEVRESLDRDEVLQERRERRRRAQEAFALEALDPASMRARYREFLQAMAARGQETQRLPQETPLEYQRRLLRIARQRRLLHDERDAELLGELTLAYAQERYGGKHIAHEHQSYLGNQVPKLVQKLAGIANTPRPATGWSQEKARWGED